MKHSDVFAMIRISFFLIIFCCMGFGIETHAQLKAGASEAAINPPLGSYIAGHSHNRKFTGIHDSLYAKAVVVENGNDAVAILTLDCIGLMYPQLQTIRQKISAIIDHKSFDASHIVLSSTHTHAGPDVVGLWGPDMMHSGVDTEYIQFLTEVAAAQVVKAWNSRQSVTTDYAVTTHGDAWVQNISEPAELDRSVTVLRFRNSNGNVVASLTNFACHPTFVDAVHDKISADYVGGLYSKLNEKWGGVNLFLQGAIGGWVQPENEPKTFEQATFRGEELGERVIASFQHAKTLSHNTIRFQSKIFEMPVENQGFKQLAAAGVIARPMKEGVNTEIAVFSIGNAWFATHPGETVPAMSLATKAMMPKGVPVFVLGLGMDALGYIVKPYFFDPQRKIPHAEYLCSMSTGKGASTVVMNVISDLIKKASENK
jgi:hypothetical protein